MGEVVDDEILFRFSICKSVPEVLNSQSKSKVVRNLAEFWTIFALPSFFFWGGGIPKLYPLYHSCIAARLLKNFREDTPSSPEVINS